MQNRAVDESVQKTFCQAVKAEDLKIVEALLAHPKIDVNAEYSGFPGYKIPLLYALKRGSLAMVELLLTSRRLDVNKAIWGGTTALHIAGFSRADQIDYIKALLDHPKIDVNVARYNIPFLHAMLFEGVDEIVQLLLRHPKINIHQTDDAGYDCLSCAMCFSDISLVEQLLKRPDIKDSLQRLLAKPITLQKLIERQGLKLFLCRLKGTVQLPALSFGGGHISPDVTTRILSYLDADEISALSCCSVHWRDYCSASSLAADFAPGSALLERWREPMAAEVAEEATKGTVNGASGLGGGGA